MRNREKLGCRIGCGLETPSESAPALDFFAQALVFLVNLIEFALQALRDGAEGNRFDQFLLAGQDVLPDDFGVAGRRSQLKVPLEVINGGSVILLLLFVKKAGFEMG